MISFYLVISLAVLLKTNPKFNPKVQRFKIILRTLHIVWYLGIAIRCTVTGQMAKLDSKAEINFETLSFILIIVGQLPICYFVLTIQEWRINRILLKDPKSLNTSADAEFLIYTLMRLIKKRRKGNNYIRIHGYLNFHAKAHSRLRKDDQAPPVIPHRRVLLKGNTMGANNTQTPSQNAQNTQSGLGFSTPWQDLIEENWSKRANPEQQDFEVELEEQAHNKFIEYLIKECLINFPKSASLKLYLAFFQYHKMKSYWKPIYLLMQITNSKCSLLEEFTAHRTLILIEKQLRVQDETTKAEVDLDVTKVVKFTYHFKKFMHYLKTSVENSLEFWYELANENPDAKKFMSLGSSILNLDKVIKMKFEDLLKFDIKKSQLYYVYAGYIKDVMHDEDNNVDIIDKAERLTKSGAVLGQSYDELEKEVNSIADTPNRMSIIEVSGSEESLGEVLSASNSTWQVFGYKPQDLVGKNISTLMYAYFAEKHDTFMRGYFYNEKTNVVNLNRMIFPRHSSGYITCCKLLLKVLPDLSKGVRLVGILTECDQSNLKMIDGVGENKENNEISILSQPVHLIQLIHNTGEIIGISESCNLEFGLKASLFDRSLSSNAPDIQLLIPGLLTPSNMQEIKSEKGFNCMIDTSLLNDDYYFVGNMDDKKGLIKNDRKNKKNNRFLEDGVSEESNQSDQDSQLNESDEGARTE